MNQTQIFLLCLCGAFFLVVALIAATGDHYSLKGIPNKPVWGGGALAMMFIIYKSKIFALG